MKQGRASREGSYGQKREPIAKEVNIPALSRLGNIVGTHVTRHGEVVNDAGSVVNGPGYRAPMNVSQTTHKGGSQGRH